MALTVLSVAYPFAPVMPDSVGGAEQVLGILDRALTAAGHRSLVIACEGSRVAGRLLPVPAVRGRIDDAVRTAGHAVVRRAVREALACHPVDIVHLHGIDFHAYLPQPSVPSLVTLHLPPGWYPPEVFAAARPNMHMVCVSASQERACPPGTRLLPHIGNGVELERLSGRVSKRNFALALGRLCPEKGFHHALDAARLAGIPLLIGGQVFPYEAHERYFAEEIRPRLGGGSRFLGPVGGARKRRLIAAARCLLVPSLAPETSSLVAMEAMAAGTPVVAFRSGALAEIVEPGVTGFLVEPGDGAAMAGAIGAAGRLDPEACRAAARLRFSAQRMAGRYLDLYERLARRADLKAGAA
ncbi:glycosyltransferase family 4 protein [Azospirillum sp. SYSU D00513]|uniref:glycosyltransferase family 4 protein n=1 Tax=Azospirillum sp. SYSU D00513 TaxID=2812561 RepID=UPI001A97657F|nr:glycosyltransferase family 4 protein [Azospirillum sp. SYSU D00513]